MNNLSFTMLELTKHTFGHICHVVGARGLYLGVHPETSIVNISFNEQLCTQVFIKSNSQHGNTDSVK